MEKVGLIRDTAFVLSIYFGKIMVLGDLNEIGRFAILGEDISIALRWIKENMALPFHKGKIEIKPERITVNCEEVAMVPRGKQFIEAHRRFIDIHVPLSGEETIGWASVSDLKNIIRPYDEEKDIIFYGEAPQCLLPIFPGQFAIFFPEDGHAPNIGTGNHRKFCVKIAL